MERKAILIEASDVAGETNLPGARVDIENWMAFLKSALGGAWKDSEIRRFNKPTSTEVKNYLEEHSGKYCLVAFSGHGSNGSVALNDYNKSCPLSTLEPKGDRGVLIVDSCRGIEKAKSFRSSVAKSAGVLSERAGGTVLLNARHGDITNFSALEDPGLIHYNRILDAQAFMNALSASQKGVVRMLACAEGEGAGEDPESGGYYTSALLDAAYAFERDTRESGILTTLQAHDYASAIMPWQQRPEYSPRSVTFPFAVK
jgi:hypothetical protein